MPSSGHKGNCNISLHNYNPTPT
uniref:Uncharacterized protein n=1 Tax=Anguilla anguilla TaxID=7936 RepID=A0A0E9W509_ANGAN